mmetsp:Transcript_24399/g.45468  ORF Transcript_24399/g.45468 Transcript_24399/m.45468 type:complete len:95 (+) Transcript_24399:2340-2624(+)
MIEGKRKPRLMYTAVHEFGGKLPYEKRNLGTVKSSLGGLVYNRWKNEMVANYEFILNFIACLEHLQLKNYHLENADICFQESNQSSGNFLRERD